MKKTGKTTTKNRRKKAQAGQAITEYILLLSMVVGIVAFFMKTLTGTLDKSTATFGGTFEKQIRTGAAPASVWSDHP